MNLKLDCIASRLEMAQFALLDSFDNNFVVHQGVLEARVKVFSQKHQDINNKYGYRHFENIMDKIYKHHDIGTRLMVYGM